MITRIVSSEFFRASFWVFIGLGFMNLGNYLFHLLMGRMLGVSLYGALESMISVLYILSVPTLTMNLLIVKFVSSYKGQGDYNAIDSFYNYIAHKLLLFGLFFLVILLLISPLIQSFLHLPSLFLAMLLPISFFINLFYFLNKSVLQGLSQFFKFSVANFVEGLTKVFCAVLLVFLGFQVIGAYGAIAISMLLGFVVAFMYVRKVVKIDAHFAKEYIGKNELVKFALPTFITTLGLTSLITTDVVLVRHFFPGTESGYYSALSVLGKIIYFATMPVVLVLFPMVSEHHARGAKYTRLLLLGLLLTFLVAGGITLVYFLIPELMILLLFGNKYLVIAGVLGAFGIFLSIHALCVVLANFFLSIHKTSVYFLVLAAALLQIILIFFFHKDLLQITMMSIITMSMLLLMLIFYYPFAVKGGNR